MARPQQLTPEQEGRIVALRARGASWRAVAELVGCADTTAMRLVARRPDLQKQIRDTQLAPERESRATAKRERRARRAREKRMEARRVLAAEEQERIRVGDPVPGDPTARVADPVLVQRSQPEAEPAPAKPPAGDLVPLGDGTGRLVFVAREGRITPLPDPPKPRKRHLSNEPVGPAPPPQRLGLAMATGVVPAENTRFAFFGQDDEPDDRDLAAWLNRRDAEHVLRDPSGKRVLRTSDPRYAAELEARGFRRER